MRRKDTIGEWVGSVLAMIGAAGAAGSADCASQTNRLVDPLGVFVFLPVFLAGCLVLVVCHRRANRLARGQEAAAIF